MLKRQLGEIVRQDEVSEAGFKVMRRAFRRLKVTYSGAHNALYGEDDLMRVLAGMSGGNCYAQESVDRSRRAERDHGGDDRARIPTPQWALGKIRETGDEGAESRSRYSDQKFVEHENTLVTRENEQKTWLWHGSQH